MSIYPYVLWGYHPRLKGPLGVVPIKLSGGDLGQVKAARRRYEHDYPGMKTGIYRSGDAPEGLRAQCKADGYQ